MSRTVSVKAEIRSGFFSAVNIAFTDVLERPEVFANFEWIHCLVLNEKKK